MRRTVILIIAALVAFGTAQAQDAPAGRLEAVRERGFVRCGVSGRLPGWSLLDEATGAVSGFDADMCRALAVAIFGTADETTLQFAFLTSSERFAALENDLVDVLFRTTTFTLTRDSDLRGAFGPIYFYDSQSVLVRRDSGITSLDQADGLTICTESGTTNEQNVIEEFNRRGLSFELVLSETTTESNTAFLDGRCAALTTASSLLEGVRGSFTNPDDYVLLPESFVPGEPIAPMSLEGDARWDQVVAWTVYAVIEAERLGVTSENVDSMRESTDVSVRRLLGVEGDLGTLLNVDNAFAANLITSVGNYGEIYQRNFPGLPREGTLNALWTEGGLLFSPPWR